MIRFRLVPREDPEAYFDRLAPFVLAFAVGLLGYSLLLLVHVL